MDILYFDSNFSYEPDTAPYPYVTFREYIYCFLPFSDNGKDVGRSYDYDGNYDTFDALVDDVHVENINSYGSCVGQVLYNYNVEKNDIFKTFDYSHTFGFNCSRNINIFGLAIRCNLNTVRSLWRYCRNDSTERVVKFVIYYFGYVPIYYKVNFCEKPTVFISFDGVNYVPLFLYRSVTDSRVDVRRFQYKFNCIVNCEIPIDMHDYLSRCRIIDSTSGNCDIIGSGLDKIAFALSKINYNVDIISNNVDSKLDIYNNKLGGL